MKLFFHLLLVLTMAVSACKKNDAKTASNEIVNADVQKLIDEGVKWISEQLKTASQRPFSDSQIEYRGKLAHVRLISDALSNDSQTFLQAQELLKTLMRDPRFQDIHQKTKFRVVKQAKLVELGYPNSLDGLFSKGEILVVEERMLSMLFDKRGPWIVLFHEYLHALGFGKDNEPAKIEGFSIPASLAILSNGQLINYLAAIAVLLSTDFRAGLSGDEPVPSGPTWHVRMFNDFNRPGLPYILAPWDRDAGMIYLPSMIEKDGFAVSNPERQTQNWALKINMWGVTPRIGNNYRIRGRLIPGGYHFTDIRIRDNITARVSATGVSITKPPLGSGCIASYPNTNATQPYIFSVTADGNNISAHINGSLVCFYHEAEFTTGPAYVTEIIGYGDKIDWLQIDDK